MYTYSKLMIVFALPLLFFLTLFHALHSVQAAEFTVTNNNDSGAGSLREAIDNANQTASADNITFDPSLNGQTIVLTSGALVISHALTIDASNLQNRVRVSGNDNSRVFYINNSGNVTMTNLVIADGTTLPFIGFSCKNLCGGGILVESDGQLTLVDSIVTENYASSGGGISSGGTLSLFNSQIVDNETLYDGAGLRLSGNTTIQSSDIISNTSNGVGGGGIYAETSESINVLSSTIAHNNTTGSGGGIYSYNPISMIIEGSTIANNVATNDGGGVYIASSFLSISAVDIRNSTISTNEGGGNGGAINSAVEFSGTLALTLTNGTISGNSSGVAIFADGTSTMTHMIRNTMIVNSTAVNCVNVTGNSYNLADDNSCDGFRQGDARLGPLTDNGGSTLTHVPLAGSMAMGRGETAVCQTDPINGIDQRGEPRAPEKCDIGATEVEDILLIYSPLIVKN